MLNRERHTLTLLIQLFGRGVLDSLERAGLTDEQDIVRAGAEGLASASGIPFPVAQRVVAVVREVAGTPPVVEDAPPAPPSGGKGTPAPGAGRSKRKKARPPRTPLRKAGAKPAAAAPPREAPSPDPDDSFVDDVALVTWMGFSAQTSSGRTPFSIADRILDAHRPVIMVSDEPPAPRPAAPAETGAVTTAEPAAVPVAAADAEAHARTLAALEPRRPSPLPGSFWSFGSPMASATSTPSPGPLDPEPTDTRDRDGH